MSPDVTTLNNVKYDLRNEFDMKDLGCAYKILGMSINMDKKKHILTISQRSYFRKFWIRLVYI